uniref:Uncharacterized protein n=1 Tax=Anopheles quadriannulatus TaxID=34691 RepID=A0A182XTI8_ANOQN
SSSTRRARQHAQSCFARYKANTACVFPPCHSPLLKTRHLCSTLGANFVCCVETLSFSKKIQADRVCDKCLKRKIKVIRRKKPLREN